MLVSLRKAVRGLVDTDPVNGTEEGDDDGPISKLHRLNDS